MRLARHLDVLVASSYETGGLLCVSKVLVACVQSHAYLP